MNSPAHLLLADRIRTGLAQDLTEALILADPLAIAWHLVTAGTFISAQEIAEHLVQATGSPEIALHHINACHDATNKLLASLALAIRTSSTNNKA